MLSEFNNTERDIGKLQLQTSTEATWSNRWARHAMSGKNIGAFCRMKVSGERNARHGQRT
jgi:hypothetical protein